MKEGKGREGRRFGSGAVPPPFPCPALLQFLPVCLLEKLLEKML